MAENTRPGHIRAPGKEIRRFRESIPKTRQEVAADGGIDERTVANVEQGEAISFRTLERVAKGLGVRYKTLLSLARGEISKLDEEGKPRFRVTITIEGDMEEKALKAHSEFLKRLAHVITSVHPLGDDMEFFAGPGCFRCILMYLFEFSCYL